MMCCAERVGGVTGRCKFWSERIAMYEHDRGVVVALCLCEMSPYHDEYTGPGDGCDHGEEGQPIDLTW